jgi:zinc protease
MLAKLKAVTAAQVKDVAARYFGDDALTVGVLDPLPMPTSARPPAAAGARH